MGMIIQNGKQYFPVYNDAIVKALPTVDTASGSVATFDTDMTENLVEVKCQIVAQQASGTPTPDNPLPILTFDHLDLFHNSINVWNEQWELGAYNVNNGEKYNSSTQIRCKNKIPIQPNTRYFKALSGTGTVYWQIYFDKYGNYLSYDGVNTNTEFITPNNAYYMVFYCEQNYGTTYNHDISINYPSTDAQYHAFNGAYIPFGQTVANGVLDVTTGKLRVEWLAVDMSNLSWTKGENNHFADLPETIKRPSSAGETANIACEIFETAPQTSYTQNNNQITYYYTGSTEALSRIIVYSTDYADLTSFETAITGYKLMWELASPLTVQLSATQISALLNENNIWCDTGDTSVKFLLTVGKKIS